MCGLCGLLGREPQWDEAGIDGLTARAHEAAKVALISELLKPLGLRARAWAGGISLTSATGRSTLVQTLPELWLAAEQLSGQRLHGLFTNVPDTGADE